MTRFDPSPASNASQPRVGGGNRDEEERQMDNNQTSEGAAGFGYERTNPITWVSRSLTPVAAAIHDRIHELGIQFEADPPFLTDPAFKEWDILRETFRRLWPADYMALLD